MKNITLKLFPILISIVFLFPILKESLSSFAVILLCINTIVYKISAKEYNFLEPKTLLLTIPFWIILISAVFSSDFQKSVSHIQHALFFLIIPVFFSLIPKEFFNRQKINLYITVLKITCLSIAIIYIVAFFLNNPFDKFFVVFQNVSSFRDYIYFNFKLIVIHPTYFTTILIFCSAHSFALVLKQKKYIELVFVSCFLLISFLLLTRLNIVLLVLLLIGMLLSMGKLSLKKRILFSATIMLLITSLALLTPGIKNRFVELYHSFNKAPVDVSYDSTNIRKAIFDCSVAIAKENLLYGVGFENLQSKLNECYGKNYDSSFYESHNYMTHNYYFYILISTGITGFILFLIYLITIIRIGIKSNIFLLNVVIFNVLILCLIEDYLYRHFGVLYFNLLLMCFIQYSKNNPQKGSSEIETLP